MLRRGSFGLVYALFLALSLANGARADAGSDARASFERGVEATRMARWEDARREFELSRSLVVKPSTLFNLAVADVKLGLGQEALRALNEFESMATEQHADMRARAKSLRAEAERLVDAAKPAGERVRVLIEPSHLDAQAQGLFVTGRDAYADGDDKLALDSFTRAYQVSKQPELLYDIGVVADRLRDDERAIAAFNRFVALAPDAPEATLARKRVARLEQVRDERRPAAVVTHDDTELTRPPANLAPPRAVLGSGVALAVGALGSALWWADRNDAADGCVRGNERCDNESQLTTQKRAAMGMTLAMGVSALALITGGSVWLAKRKRAPELHLQAGRERLVLGLRASF